MDKYIKVGISKMKANFYKYIDILGTDKTYGIIITKYGKEVAVLTPIGEEAPLRLGAGKGFFPENLKYDLTNELYYSPEELGIN